jgi:Response regulator containing a CheY-like receiver domain and an HTH DNA-binding domain
MESAGRFRDSIAARGIGYSQNPSAPERLFDCEGNIYRVVAWESGEEAGNGGASYRVAINQDTGSRRQNGESGLLTPRETETLFLLAQRATNREIAATMGISRHTARHHTQRVLEKLGLKSRSQIRSWLLGEQIATVR